MILPTAESVLKHRSTDNLLFIVREAHSSVVLSHTSPDDHAKVIIENIFLFLKSLNNIVTTKWVMVGFAKGIGTDFSRQEEYDHCIVVVTIDFDRWDTSIG